MKSLSKTGLRGKVMGGGASFLLSLLWLSQAVAQEKIITLKREPWEISGRDFYIKAVVDARPNREIVGYAQVGPFNKRVVVKFPQPVKNELRDYLNETLPPLAGQQPILLRLLTLAVTEKTTMFSESAMAAAKIEFYFEQEGRVAKIYETEAHYKRGAMDVTKFHEENLRLVLAKCLMSFHQAGWRTVAPVFSDSSSQFVTVAESASEQSENRVVEKNSAYQKEHFYALGFGGAGWLQQNDLPLQFGKGVRLFFDYQQTRGNRLEIAFEYQTDRAFSGNAFFALSDDSRTFVFSRVRQFNLEIADKIALRSNVHNFPFVHINIGSAIFKASNALAISNSTLQVSKANARLTGVYFGAGLGYRHALSQRFFIESAAVLNYVIVNSATAAKKSGRLPKSQKSLAEAIRVQLGYGF